MSVAPKDPIATELPCLAAPPVLRLIAPPAPPRSLCLVLEDHGGEALGARLRDAAVVTLVTEPVETRSCPDGIAERHKRILHGFALATRLFPHLPLVVAASGEALCSVRALLRAERTTTRGVVAVLDTAVASTDVLAKQVLAALG